MQLSPLTDVFPRLSQRTTNLFYNTNPSPCRTPPPAIWRFSRIDFVGNHFFVIKIPQAGPPCWESGLSCPTLQAGVDPGQAARAAVTAVTEAVCARDGLPSTGTVEVVDGVFTLVQLALDDRRKEGTKQTGVFPAENAFRSVLVPVRIVVFWSHE